MLDYSAAYTDLWECDISLVLLWSKVGAWLFSSCRYTAAVFANWRSVFSSSTWSMLSKATNQSVSQNSLSDWHQNFSTKLNGRIGLVCKSVIIMKMNGWCNECNSIDYGDICCGVEGNNVRVHFEDVLLSLHCNTRDDLVYQWFVAFQASKTWNIHEFLPLYVRHDFPD